MNLESLLVSSDAVLVRTLRPILEKLSIEAEVCQDGRKATDVLVSEKFDAVIVDCDDLRGGLEVLQGLRNTPSNKTSVVFAVLNGKKTSTQQAFEMGANFVLQKPISGLNATRCFNAALNFMVRERRRYFRQPLKIAVRILIDDADIKATSTNISEGGIALLLRQALPKNATPRLSFVLPGTDSSLTLDSEVAWVDMKGCAGFRFRNISELTQELLEKWLDSQAENDSPKIAESKQSADATLAP